MQHITIKDILFIVLIIASFFAGRYLFNKPAKTEKEIQIEKLDSLSKNLQIEMNTLNLKMDSVIIKHDSKIKISNETYKIISNTPLIMDDDSLLRSIIAITTK